MGKIRIFAVTALLLAAFGCSPEAGNAGFPEQLRAVPSDALAVIAGGNCKDCLSRLDSTHIFNSIDAEAFRKSKAVLAFCHTNSLTPILVLEAGPADTVARVRDILRNASELGIKARYVAPVPGYIETGNIVFTATEASMAAAMRHIDGRTSILDAPGFKEALQGTDGWSEWTMLRNSGASKLVPRDFLKEHFSWRELTGLLHNASDWTCMTEDISGNYTINAMRGDSDIYFANIFSAQEPKVCKLGRLLPENTSLAIDLPIDAGAYRSAYEKYLDAALKLEKYNSTIKSLQKTSGKNPLKWEEELDICEVALVKWDGMSVAMVRPARTPRATEAGENPYKGFIQALYGSAFAIPDDSFTAIMEGWLISGSEDDVTAFVDAVRFEEFSWPERTNRFVVYTPGATLYQGKDAIKLEISTQQKAI